MKDRIFRAVIFFCAFSIILLTAAIFLTLASGSVLVFKSQGIDFLFSGIWNPAEDHFGIVPFFAGTMITSFLSLFLSLPFSISVGILLGEYIKKGKIAIFLQNLTDLMAGIPSVIYGFWGLFFLVPVVQKIEMKLNVTPYGVGIITASIILSIMIIPYTASLSREVISLVPEDLKEAAYSLGATRWEVIRHIILPYAKSGIFAGILLSFGRAAGETMAVTMVIGNRDEVPKSLFDPANTMASVIANQFAEATSDLYISALIGVGFMLFVITTVINIAGRYVIKRLEVR